MHRLSQDFWWRGLSFALLPEQEETTMNEKPVIPCKGCTDGAPDYDDRVHWTPHTFVGEQFVKEDEPCNLDSEPLMRRSAVENEQFSGPAWRQMFRCDRCGVHRQYGCTEAPLTCKSYGGCN